MRGIKVIPALSALILSSCSGSQPAARVLPSSHLRVSPAAHSYHPSSSVGLPLSIATIDDDHVLICDTLNVYRLTRTRSGYAVAKLARPAVPGWNPTGLAYQGGSVYVANGSGHDLLTLRLQGDRLNLIRRITEGALRSPQNVVVESDGSMLVADTESGAVLRYDGDGHLRWRASVEGAHGVAVSDGFVYASSLVGRTIQKLDQSGNLVASAGGIGGSVGRYLWPTALANTGDGILVTDALSGRISILDQDLHVVRYAGANGPGLDALDFPYATLPIADGYLIADTYKQRLLRVSRDWVIQEQIAVGRAVPSGRERPLISVADGRPSTFGVRPLVSFVDGSVSAALPGVDVAGALGLRPSLSFVGTFGGLDHFGADGSFSHVDFSDSQVQYTGLTWAQRVGSLIVVGSPETASLEVIDPATGMFTSVDVGSDAWWLAGRLLLSANVLRELPQVIGPAVDAFSEARQLLERGTPREVAFDKALDAGRQRDWSLDLKSPAAQRFLHSGRTRADARQYFDQAFQQPEQTVVELLEVKYLSGS